MEYPRLIENNAKYYIQQTLQKCHEHRISIYLTALNVGVFVVFAGLLAAVLYYSYTYKLNPNEAMQKRYRDQSYILSKIRYYQDEQKNISATGITKLPVLDPNTPFI